METDSVKETILAYEEQLLHIDAALLSTANDVEKDKLLSLKSDIQQLLDLTRETCLIDHEKESPEVTTSLNDEYAQFILEMQKEGAIEESNTNKNNLVNTTLFGKSLKELEGTKCKAPHKHNWGETVYHNAMICTVLQPDRDNDIEVKVMFINPTDQEMLPCPYFLETDCKFSEDQCRFSHGKTVLLSSLREYIEPNFESIIIGSKVLAKRYNKLWHRASVIRLLNQKCIVKFESNTEEVELNFHDILPLDSDNTETVCDIESEEESNYEDVVNMSLVITPASQALGEWEKFTKGIGSKLMAKMGYITGSGLGKKSDGILEPVSAVVLPAGKSLDYCMNLREHSGDDKDLFNAEKRMKKFKKKREILNQKAYEREKKKVDVFNFLNDALMRTEKEDMSSITKFKHRQEIKKETSRDLNVASLKIEENIKGIERELFKIQESLSRHSDKNSQLYKSLILQQNKKQYDLKSLKDQAINIRNEQNIRRDKRKLTVF